MTYQEFLRRAEEDNCDTLGVTVNCENCATLIALCRKLEAQRDGILNALDEVAKKAEWGHVRAVTKNGIADCNAELDKIVEGGT